jgi:hypothetical protein
MAGSSLENWRVFNMKDSIFFFGLHMHGRLTRRSKEAHSLRTYAKHTTTIYYISYMMRKYGLTSGLEVQCILDVIKVLVW